jgi:hypothetical protein
MKKRFKTKVLNICLILSFVLPVFLTQDINKAEAQATLAGNDITKYNYLMDGMFSAIKNLSSISELNQADHPKEPINQFNSLYNQVKPEMPLNTPKYITVGSSIQPLNIEIWLDRHVVIFGDYKGLNPRSVDFKPTH